MLTFRKPVAAHLRRSHERKLIKLPTFLYLPAEDFSQSCRLFDLSIGGAQIGCEAPPPLAAYVILHIEGFGRFEAVTAWFREESLGVRFLIGQARRERLAAQIDAFEKGGVEAAALSAISARD